MVCGAIAVAAAGLCGFLAVRRKSTPTSMLPVRKSPLLSATTQVAETISTFVASGCRVEFYRLLQHSIVKDGFGNANFYVAGAFILK